MDYLERHKYLKLPLVLRWEGLTVCIAGIRRDRFSDRHGVFAWSQVYAAQLQL